VVIGHGAWGMGRSEAEGSSSFFLNFPPWGAGGVTSSFFLLPFLSDRIEHNFDKI